MLQNPKTTLSGYLLILIAVLSAVQHWYAGGGIVSADVQSIVNAVSAVMGMGLVSAQDGGH